MSWLVYDDTIFRWLFYSCNHNGSLIAVIVVELDQLLEWIVANNIGVQDEERGVVFSENLLSEFERASGAQGFGLDGELDANVVFLLVLHIEFQHNLGSR